VGHSIGSSAGAGGMPAFGLASYEAVLDRFGAQGYAARVIPDLDAPEEPRPVLYLRHDLDLLVTSALPMAVAEAERGLRATYYVLLTGPYNAFVPEHRRALRELVGLGHEIGLHYDLRVEAEPPTRAELDRWVAALEGLVGAPVRTISTHNPSLGGDDPFRSLPGLRHPHDPCDTRELVYVSDSRRRWRDDRLLECFGDSPPARVMFLTHPELWLDPEMEDAERYLRDRVAVQALGPTRHYLEREVPALWREVEDTPESETGFRMIPLDRSTAEARLDELEKRFRQFPDLGWTREQILAERPGKWEQSVVAVDGDGVAGFSINSLRDGHLYVHVLFVGPEHRRTGLGRALVEHLVERARGAGLAAIDLRVALDNTSALRFYLTCGFQIAAVEVDEQQLVLSRPVPGTGDERNV
jgi:ribosomal protein S18 acetylase RimI-like enzyme